MLQTISRPHLTRHSTIYRLRTSTFILSTVSQIWVQARAVIMLTIDYAGPLAQDRNGKLIQDLTENPLPTWKKLEEMVDKGKIRNIGVSK